MHHVVGGICSYNSTASQTQCQTQQIWLIVCKFQHYFQFPTIGSKQWGKLIAFGIIVVLAGSCWKQFFVVIKGLILIGPSARCCLFETKGRVASVHLAVELVSSDAALRRIELACLVWASLHPSTCAAYLPQHNRCITPRQGMAYGPKA